MTSLRRLTKEFEALEKNPLDFCEVTPADDKLSAEAHLQGPPGTPYAAGVWTVDLAFPENYPFKAPTVKFRTEIKHPNVKTDTGEVCPEVPRGVRRLRPPHAIDTMPAQVFFPNWSPTMNVRLVLSNVREVLKNPVVETPLEAELAELYANDRPKFDKLVKDHVKGLGKKKK
jgi:ubiquitin-protein ligase